MCQKGHKYMYIIKLKLPNGKWFQIFLCLHCSWMIYKFCWQELKKREKFTLAGYCGVESCRQGGNVLVHPLHLPSKLRNISHNMFFRGFLFSGRNFRCTGRAGGVEVPVCTIFTWQKNRAHWYPAIGVPCLNVYSLFLKGTLTKNHGDTSEDL
jgi:hypothetical protein